MRKCVIVLMLMLVAVPVPAQIPGLEDLINIIQILFGGSGGGARESTQILNKILIATGNGHLVEIIANAKKIYDDAVRNTKAYNDLFATEQGPHMDALLRALAFGQAITHANQQGDQVWSERFPGYARVNGSYQDAYKKWNDTARDTIIAVLRHNQARSGLFNINNQLAGFYRVRADDADGRQQTLQSIAAIDSLAVEQLTELSSIVMADSNARMMAQSVELQKQATSEAAAEHWFTFVPQQEKGNRVFTIQ